jgi:putative transposase
MGPAKWSYFYLYVIIDIFSRRVVGWCVADRESATLFAALFEDATTKHPAPKGQLTLHADRGGPMRAKATALLLADLGVTKSHSRPHTSNDNPFSESHFGSSVFAILSIPCPPSPCTRLSRAPTTTQAPSLDPTIAGLRG